MDSDAESRESNEKPGSRILSWLREIAVVIVAAIILSLLIKLFLMRAFYIPSRSMMDTLDVNDRIMVSELAPRFFSLDRGDIVVFNDPGGWLKKSAEPDPTWWQTALTFIGLYPKDAGDQVVKRIVGLPGDTVKCCSPQGELVVNGTPIHEKYLEPGMPPSQIKFKVTVQKNHLWVMGDNRSNSADSRFPGHGAVPIDDVVGRVFLINWPLDRIRWISTPSAVFADVPDSPKASRMGSASASSGASGGTGAVAGSADSTDVAPDSANVASDSADSTAVAPDSTG